jgi:hypothetical protein
MNSSQQEDTSQAMVMVAQPQEDQTKNAEEGKVLT